MSGCRGVRRHRVAAFLHLLDHLARDLDGGCLCLVFFVVGADRYQRFALFRMRNTDENHAVLGERRPSQNQADCQGKERLHRNPPTALGLFQERRGNQPAGFPRTAVSMKLQPNGLGVALSRSRNPWVRVSRWRLFSVRLRLVDRVGRQRLGVDAGVADR